MIPAMAEPTAYQLLQRVAERVSRASGEALNTPLAVIQVDVDFGKEPAQISIGREVVVPHQLRDPDQTVPIPVDDAVRRDVAEAMALFQRETRRTGRVVGSLTLTISADGKFSFGAAYRGPEA